jgi:flagellar protein FliO/FliZ
VTLLLAVTDTMQAPAVPGPELSLPIWQTLVSLLVVLGLLAALAWALRKGLLTRRGGQMLAVETALALGERRSLVVVTVEGRRLLLGLTPGQVSLVTELKPPPTFEQTVAHATGEPTA